MFDNWPEEWKEEAVSKAEILRLIYQVGGKTECHRGKMLMLKMMQYQLLMQNIVTAVSADDNSNGH